MYVVVGCMYVVCGLHVCGMWDGCMWYVGCSVTAICWALLCIEEVGNTIEDPFNMPFLFKGPPYRDELKVG